MAILNFQKPDKIVLNKTTEFEGQFEFKPLEPGFGQTVGNSLRRVLLSSLEGFSISAVRIAGVEHEFATIRGVVRRCGHHFEPQTSPFEAIDCR